jgi:hypothetical protein
LRAEGARNPDPPISPHPPISFSYTCRRARRGAAKEKEASGVGAKPGRQPAAEPGRQTCPTPPEPVKAPGLASGGSVLPNRRRPGPTRRRPSRARPPERASHGPSPSRVEPRAAAAHPSIHRRSRRGHRRRSRETRNVRRGDAPQVAPRRRTPRCPPPGAGRRSPRAVSGFPKDAFRPLAATRPVSRSVREMVARILPPGNKNSSVPAKKVVHDYGRDAQFFPAPSTGRSTARSR